MFLFGQTARRVVYAILITALIPLLSAFFVSRAVIERISAAAFQPEFDAHIERSIGVYAELAKALKQAMRAEAQVIAGSSVLKRAVTARDEGAIKQELTRAITDHPTLVSLRVERCAGALVAERDRGKPVDPAMERTLEVRRPLGDEHASCDDDEKDAMLVATFAAPRARFDELSDVEGFARSHAHLRAHFRDYVATTYERASAAILAVTLVVAVAAGSLVVRPVTKRIAALAAATRPVAEGDLSVRVGLSGNDEVAELGRAFDRMLEELDRSRARLDFLKRMSEWQKVARRLAHEIKNPLTPIQLAVEECHRRYRGDDPVYRRIVETTLEVVEEEIASLRRLVGQFSSFARLPRADLMQADLAAFLREQGDRFTAIGRAEEAPEEESDGELYAGVSIAFDVPEGEMPAAMDAEMLHRVLANAIRNAAQAIRDMGPKRGGKGNVRVTARREGDEHVITIDDDGPGIPAEVASVLFDPYVTTKRDGTGLGLSIVKKIVMDHGGAVSAGSSPLGGARLRIAIPRAGTRASEAAALRAASEVDAPLST